MSYGEIGYIRHIDYGENSWRIALLEKDYTGGSTEFKADMPVFQLNYVEQPTLFDSFMASELTIFINLPDITLINNVANSGVGKYLVTLSKSDEIVWTGYIDPSITSYTSEHGFISTQLRAICGIGLWERLGYLYEGFTDTIQLPAEYLPIKNALLKFAQKFSHNISWGVFGESGDILDGLSLNDKVNRSGTDGDYQTISQKTVADQIAKRFLSRWYQWRGWKLEQPEGTLHDTVYKQYTTGGTGFDSLVHGGAVTVTDNDFVDGLSTDFEAAISSSMVTYKHGMNGIIDAISTDNTTGFAQNYLYDYQDGNKILLSGSIAPKQAQTNNPLLFVDFIISAGAGGQTTKYWDNSNKEWINSNPHNRTWLINPAFFPFTVETDDIPEDYTTFGVTLSEIYVGTFLNTNTRGAISGNTVINANVQITGNSDGSADSKVTQAITDNDAAGTYDHGELYFSTGIADFDLSALKITGSTNRALSIISPGNTTAGLDIDGLTTLSINRFAKVAKRKIRGVLLDTSYEPSKTLTYDSKSYYFLGGSVDGTGYWQGVWQELSYADESVTFRNYTQSDGNANGSLQQGQGTLLNNSLALAFNRAAQTESEQLTTLTTAIAAGATVTSLTITAINSGDAIAALKSGYKVNLLNIRTGLQQIFTISSDYVSGATSLSVSSATSITDFTSGSALILNGESLQSYVIKTAQFYTAGVQAADVQSIATVSGTVSNSVAITAIPVSALSYQITDGQKLRIVDADDANTFDEVEVSTDTASGATSIPILSTTLTNAYSSGDSVVFTVAQSSGLLYILAGSAGVSATNSSNSASTAGTARDAAVTASNLSQDARDAAETFKDNAETFKNSASSSATASASSAQAALTAKTQSESFASSASASATSASGYASTSLTARNDAQTAAGSAQSALSQVSASVNGLDTQIVLKGITNADGTTSMALVRLDTSPSNSNVTISADDIEISGKTTFLSAISSAISSGAITSPGAKVTRSNNAPSNAALNDVWVDTNDGNKPYSYNGSVWEPMFTIIDGGNLTTGSITAAKIASNAITAAKISAGAITTDKISAGAITAVELAVDAIETDKISAGAITTVKIATSTITADKITSGAITSPKIAAGAVTADKITVTNLSAVNANTGNLTVSGILKSNNYVANTSGYALNQNGTAEFQSVTVKGVLIAGSGSDIDWDYVNNVQIITAQIGDAQITSAKIADATITTAKIGDAQITSAKIADATITSAKIDSLDAAKINATSLSSITTSTGSLAVSGTLTLGLGGSIEMSSGNTITDDGISLEQGSGTKITTDPSVINWGNDVSIYGTFQGVGGHTLQIEASTMSINANLDCFGVVSLGSLNSSFRGSYKSSDDSAGISATRTWTDQSLTTHSVTIKNGLITTWTTED